MKIIEIKNLVAKNKLEEAINELSKISQDNLFFQLQFRLTLLNEKIIAGIISTEDENIERYSICNAILMYCDKTANLFFDKLSTQKGSEISISPATTESYPKFIFTNSLVNPSANDMYIIVQGEIPLYDLSFEVIDELGAQNVLRSFNKGSFNDLDSNQRKVYLETLHPFVKSEKINYTPNGFTNQVGEIQFGSELTNYEICIMSWARNGSFFQRTKFEKDKSGNWKTKSYKISKMNRDPNKLGVLLEKYSK